MSSIKSVVKVMNFHSLLRVDKARTAAKKYTAMEEVLTDMLDNIMNNRNIVIDNKTLRVKPEFPKLRIYIGSDMGFCNNLNSLVSNELQKEIEEDNVDCVVIGRKIRRSEKNALKLFQTREEFNEDNSKVMKLLEDGIGNLRYSNVQIIYNHYYNSSQVQLVRKQIFPVEKTKAEKTQGAYREDFTFESEVDDILMKLVVLYAKYYMEIAAAASFAAENISRQNVTTESLKKIDEREENIAMQDRKAQKDKQFAKVLDNYTKMKQH